MASTKKPNTNGTQTTLTQHVIPGSKPLPTGLTLNDVLRPAPTPPIKPAQNG